MAFASSRVRVVLVALCGGALLTGSSRLQAQKKCNVEDDNSSESQAGRLFLSRATDPKVKDQAQKDSSIRQAVGAMGAKFNPNKEFGRDFYLGEALVLEAANPNNPVEGSRSQFGFKSDQDPSGHINILAYADTLLNDLAKGRPECALLADQVRLQAYPPLTNAAIQALQDTQYARADTLARRAEMVYQKSPYVYNVLAGVDVRRNDLQGAVDNYNKVIALSGDSANYKKIKPIAMYNLAVVRTSLAEAATGSDKKDKGDSAVAAWKAYQAATVGDATAQSNAQAGLTHALQISGDSAAAAGLYADMVNNPAKYTDIQLFQSAIAATRANDQNDAMKLFQAGLQKNPYFRDGLYYVANTEFNNGQIDSLMPTVRRLLSVDPNNPEDYRLLAGAYQLRQREAKDPKMKRALGDSIVSALSKYQKPSVKLTVTNYTNDGSKIAVGGMIENLSDSAHTYTPKFQFLDAGGNVVGSADSPPVQVPAKGTGKFNVAANASNAIAYKYEPLQ